VSSTHLLGLINDILDMSKIESGKLDLDDAPLSIAKILVKVNVIMNEQAALKNIDLNIVEGEGADAQYMGDELRLTQVITNLMSNAVKFTPEGGSVTLSVEEAAKEADFSVLRFAVSDTGIGITAERRDRLFDAFEQADGSITRRYGGSGLGLAISKNIVEKMNGRIWVESELGKGSVFTFEVRLAHVAPEAPTDIEAGQAAPQGMPDFSGAAMLLAEDVDINREIFITLLEGTGIEIDTAANGMEAVEKFRRDPERYCAIVMDIQMPVMNGYEATVSIRSLDMDRAKGIPIIAMSADAFKEDIDRCLACGMNGHLKKPIELEKVIETLSLYCAGTK
jgi:CheY-like chemotaxis protein